MEDKSQQDLDQNPTPNFELDIHAQYIKDLSFENPDILKMLENSQELPNIDININVNHTALDKPDMHEVTLLVRAKGKKDDKELFILELTYAGVFSIKDADENLLYPILMIECPRLLFPFVRNIISDISRDGGYPPLLLKPVDFVELYRQRLESLASETQGNA